jgi:hypothetical protein
VPAEALEVGMTEQGNNARDEGWLLRLLTRLYRNTDWLENPPPRRKVYRGLRRR